MTGNSLRARGTRAAHLYKALFRQHHTELRPLLAKLIGKDATVLDVGAHAGQFAKLFAKLAKDGTVYAFEPSPYARAILTTVVRLKRLYNVRVVTAGVGAEPGTLSLQTPIKASGSLGFGLAHFGDSERREPLQRTEVPVTTLDAFCAEHDLRPSFIKADIEGWELQMLRGATTVLRDARPALILEVVDSHLHRAGDSRAALFRFLADAGYDRFAVSGSALRPSSDDAGDDDYLFIAAGDPRRGALGI